MPAGLKSNLKSLSSDFCANSTAHGVQHLPIREKSLPRTFFWSLIFMATVIGSSIHLYSITSAYLEYSFYETITNELKNDLQLPDITICDPGSMSPHSVNAHLEDNVHAVIKMNIMDKNVKDFLKEYPGMINLEKELFRNQVQMAHTLYSNLPVGRKNITGISIKELLVFYRYKKHPCSYENFTQYIHPDMLNCYTFKYNARETEENMGGENGLSFIIKSQNGHDVDPNYLVYSNVMNTYGLIVAIHEPSTLPNMEEGLFQIQPGMSTSIGLKQKNYERISTPKLSCLEEDWFNAPSGKFKKSFETCIKMCKIKFIQRECSCTTLLTIPPLLPEEDDYCNRINLLNITDSMEKVYCEVDNYGGTDEELDTCKASCLWPCHMIKYEMSRYSSAWPNQASIPDFIEKYILSFEDDHPIKIDFDILID